MTPTWLVIHRVMSTPDKGGHRVQLPGVILPFKVRASDRAAAEAQVKASTIEGGRLAVGRLEVVAECSWNLMSAAERARLLGDYTPPDETREQKLRRLNAIRGPRRRRSA